MRFDRKIAAGDLILPNGFGIVADLDVTVAWLGGEPDGHDVIVTNERLVQLDETEREPDDGEQAEVTEAIEAYVDARLPEWIREEQRQWELENGPSRYVFRW